MKIYSWRKFLTFIATFIAIVLLLAILILSIISGQEKRTPEATESYTVQSGETLWSIGTKYRPDDMSIQEYIYNLKDYNNIGSIIYAGQVIEVLIY